MFKTIKADISAELVEKKSKFIANAYYVESVEEAEEKIKEINKKYFDARHNCYAFSIYTDNGIITRFSDNGEPSGTAGGPMLNIIQSTGISNCLVVVTRYFGGILLGTGGLVRAYSDATKLALENTEIIIKDLGIEVKFIISYSDLQKLQYYFNKNDIKILDTKYNENIEVFFEITKEKYEDILKQEENVNLNFNILNKEILKDKYIEVRDGQ